MSAVRGHKAYAKDMIATVSAMPLTNANGRAPPCSGETIVTTTLPLVMLAVKVVVVVVVFGIPLPLMVIPRVKALVEAVVTVVLPLVVSAVIVEDNPVLLTQGLPVLWQATQNVGLVVTLYWLVPRLGVAATPSMVTPDVSPS